jgi:hypothetical protein
MRGIVRPCPTHLGPELHARWQAHLCGLCLTLRDAVGQPERVLTGYDVLLLSVLVEAQAGEVATTVAAPCPLRGFTRATVVASDSAAGRLAAAGALVSAAAGLADKIVDDDLPRPVRPSARRVAARLDRSGTALAGSVGFDPATVLAAPAASAAAEQVPGADLRSLLAASGEAVASLFAHTAVVADRPANAAALADCGRAFGALVHLLDAVEDHASDAAAGRFNPLTATGTEPAAARRLADELVDEVRAALVRAELADPALVEVLLGRELVAAVDRALPPLAPRECCSAPATGAPSVPEQRRAVSGLPALLLALWALLAPLVFIGGSWGGGGWGPRRRPPRGWPPPRGYPPPGYPPPGYGYGPRYGYRSVGPSCGQLLACNCCANLACNACCCGSSCANG